VSGPGEWVVEIPLQAVPERVVAAVADLAFAGRYVPAGPGPEPIAGDFYDLLRLDDDLIAVVVGDVAGHGASALVRMRQLRAAARAYAIQEPGPASVVSRLDRFCGRLAPEAIATLWYGEYRPSTGVLTYASAGHPPPVLTCHGDPTRLLREASTPPLGAGAADVTAEEHQEVLPVGAVLVAYSDGLVERRGADFGDQLALLREIVDTACNPAAQGSADDIAGAILGALVPAPGAAEDDVCLLVVRREPPG
jgi:serine phosphatase RsbU (regulator of sigma subunit)